MDCMILHVASGFASADMVIIADISITIFRTRASICLLLGTLKLHTLSNRRRRVDIVRIKAPVRWRQVSPLHNIKHNTIMNHLRLQKITFSNRNARMNSIVCIPLIGFYIKA
ncbi:hypothetical protein HanHA300_Chr06g0211511 [Helianthus annuus]|nr:hypothetical protein HanHA300_Chr06g0211511 [Helianthus annuus]